LLGAAEWTVECNPATVSLAKAKLLRSYGVNRISMGVQSLDEALLERLGRIHTREMVFKSFDTLREAGFDNLNLDLMFAIPGQTMEIWQATLSEALALGSEHLSSYEVIYEEDTALYAQLQAREFDLDEDLACAMYEELVDRASGAGFRQYEIANFARFGVHPLACSRNTTSLRAPDTLKGGHQTGAVHRQTLNKSSLSSTPDTRDSQNQSLLTSAPTDPAIPSQACAHNVNYWRGGSFYGLGPSATSYVRGVRTKNWSNTQLYCEQLEQGKRAIESREALPPFRRAGETAAFGLRMVAGWPFEQFRQTTGYDLRREWDEDMKKLAHQGWGDIGSDGFRLTRRGLRFADAAAEMFLR
jgi:oxygen-independent coproporphyrinogen-3 oxidase